MCKQTQQLPTLLEVKTCRASWEGYTHKTIRLGKLEGDHVQCTCIAPTMLEEVCKQI